MKKKVVRVALGLTVGAGLLFWWLSLDRCRWEQSAPALTALQRARGQLSAGAAKVAVEIPLPVVVGGYGPPRSEATGAQGAPISARALHVEVGGSRFAVVVLDVLLVPPALADAVRAGRGYPVWVLATHTHSSLGAYDARWGPQLAALGRYEPARFDALVKAAGAALDQARASAAPAVVEASEAAAPGLAAPRNVLRS